MAGQSQSIMINNKRESRLDQNRSDSPSSQRLTKSKGRINHSTVERLMTQTIEESDGVSNSSPLVAKRRD
jgi:hypothetical protein